jgi:hypothetical protein
MTQPSISEKLGGLLNATNVIYNEDAEVVF